MHLPAVVTDTLNRLRGRTAAKSASYLSSGIPCNWPQTWWQADWRKPDLRGNPGVEACVGIYSRTVAMMPIQHQRVNDRGGWDDIHTSPAARVLRKPNGYQTRADFFLNLVRSELLTGNGYAYAVRDNRYAVSELHLLPARSTTHYIEPDNKDIYYSIGGNQLLPDEDGQIVAMAPARDILHIRLHTPNDPLTGETPLVAAYGAVASGEAIQGHNASFFTNMRRPSGILSTDTVLTKEQMTVLRGAWDDQAKGINAGGVPILSAGLKWAPMSVSSVDSQLIEFYKLSIVDIARVYGVPMPLIGGLENATLNNAETLIQHWLDTGLQFVIAHIELTLEALFGLPPGERLRFDVDALLRADFLQRMDGLTKGVIGGIYSINEARAKEGLPEVEYGEEPRVQQQVVPVSYYYDEQELREQEAAAPDPEPEPPEPEPDEPDPEVEAAARYLEKKRIAESLKKAVGL